MFGMFSFGGMSTGVAILVWLAVFAALFGLNEAGRRFKWVGFFMFFVMPVILTIMWFTVLSGTAYMDWFHLAKVYSSTAGCIGFWCIRFVRGKNRKTGKEWRLSESKAALCFPPLILAINIAEAVTRDFEVGRLYNGVLTLVRENNQTQTFLGGSWNYMNGVAGILNIVTITGWLGIRIRKETRKDKSRDMLWPDMLWFWVVAYDLWNFAYTYNCLPNHAWYCGLALLIAPTLCAFTVGKGDWLQHRAQTLALFCMWAQTDPGFIDTSSWAVKSTNNPKILFAVSLIALASNVAVAVYMLYKVIKTRKNPYAGELYADLRAYGEVRALAE